MSQVAFDLATTRSKASGLPTFKPSLDEENYIRDGLAYLVVKAPFFAHILYNECRLLYSKAIPYAATDGRSIFVNPAGMQKEKMGLYEVAFVLAHEVGHVIFGHQVLAVKWRRDGYVIYNGLHLPYSPEIMNMAQDFVINAMVIDGKIGKMPAIGLFDKQISEKGLEATVEVYAKLIKDAKIIKLKVPGGMAGHGGFDIHLEASDEQVKDEETGRREQAIAAAAEMARSAGQGTIPEGALRLIGEILEPRVSWKDKLRSTVHRHGGDPIYDWRYLDKRLLARSEPMYFARQSHSGAGTVVVGGDTSGSIGDKEVNIFFSEMHGIAADLNPENMYVLWCDAAVHRVDHLEDVDDLGDYKEVVKREGGVGGGGGTNFRPVFKWVEEQGIVPDMLIYLTDTYGTFPATEPDYPVIWASIVDDQDRVPWGDFVFVDVDE